MLIREFAGDATQGARLAALAQFLVSRAEDKSAPKKISSTAFVNLANSMSIPITLQQLPQLIAQPPLSEIIDSIENDEILFRGDLEKVSDTLTVDQARNTVDSMAKRAIDIK